MIQLTCLVVIFCRKSLLSLNDIFFTTEIATHRTNPVYNTSAKCQTKRFAMVPHHSLYIYAVDKG